MHDQTQLGLDDAQMRICVIGRSTPEHGPGGMERVLADLALEWAQAGHSVTVVTTPNAGDAQSFEWANVQVIRVDGRPGRYSRRWAQRVAALDFSDFDIIMGVSSAARYVARLQRSIPVIMQAHGTSLDELRSKFRSGSPKRWIGSVRNLYWLFLDAADYRRYSMVIGVGPSVQASLSGYPPLWRPRRYATIPNGVRRQGLETHEGHRSGAVFVGRLHQEKGVDLAIRACAADRRPLRVVGDGPAAPSLRQLVQTLGVENVVTFVGRAGPSDVRAELQRAEVMLAPSRRREGLPLVVLEALSNGTPAIVSPSIERAFAGDLPGGVSVARGKDSDTWIAAIRSFRPAGRVELPPQNDLEVVAQTYVSCFRRLIESDLAHG